MPSKLYDILKYIALIGLPAIGTLYFSLANIWNLPYAVEVEGTIAAIEVCLGTLLQLSTYQYNKKNNSES